MTKRSENVMDKIINTIEWLAAMFVGIVALNIFIAVVLRKFFNTSIPDSYDFGRMLLSILIFWGIAATSYRGGHITVDLVWTAAGPPPAGGRRSDTKCAQPGGEQHHRADLFFARLAFSESITALGSCPTFFTPSAHCASPGAVALRQASS